MASVVGPIANGASPDGRGAEIGTEIGAEIGAEIGVEMGVEMSVAADEAPKVIGACSGCHQLVKWTSAGRRSCATASSPSMAARTAAATAAASDGGDGRAAKTIHVAFPK
jgi:hypothetical protein